MSDLSGALIRFVGLNEHLGFFKWLKMAALKQKHVPLLQTRLKKMGEKNRMEDTRGHGRRRVRLLHPHLLPPFLTDVYFVVRWLNFDL